MDSRQFRKSIDAKTGDEVFVYGHLGGGKIGLFGKIISMWKDALHGWYYRVEMPDGKTDDFHASELASVESEK